MAEPKNPPSAQGAKTSAPGASPAKPAVRPPAATGDFGDAALAAIEIRPIAFDRRTQKASAYFARLLALTWSPAPLLLLAALMPLVGNAKVGLLLSFFGAVAGAVAAACVNGPLLRYGVSLGVFWRLALGPRGAKWAALARALFLNALLAEALLDAAQALVWGALCTWPDAAPRVLRWPDLAGISPPAWALYGVLAGLVIALAKKTWSRPGWLVLPGLSLIIILAAMPFNLPPGAVWNLVDATRATPGTGFALFTASFCWSMTLFLAPAHEVRKLPTQAGQTIAVLAAGPLPWLLGSLVYAVASLSTGPSAYGFFDVTEIVCRRAPTWLAMIACVLEALALALPLAVVVLEHNRVAVGEISAAAMRPKARARLGRALFIAPALIVALIAGLAPLEFAAGGLARHFWLAGVAFGALLALISLLALFDFYAVQRGRIVLDDLYHAGGLYAGVAGVSPAALIAMGLAGAAGVFLWSRGGDVRLAVAGGGAALLVSYFAAAKVQRARALRRRR